MTDDDATCALQILTLGKGRGPEQESFRATPPTRIKQTTDQNESRAPKRHWRDWFGP
jgi:hypothetical protein